MAQIIRFNNGTEDIDLTVQNCYSYTYNAMKTVLKLTINETDHSFAEIEQLKNNIGDISYIVDNEVRSIYSGYEYPDKGFNCNYSDGVFELELTQSGSLDVRVTALEEAVEAIMMIIAGE